MRYGQQEMAAIGQAIGKMLHCPVYDCLPPDIDKVKGLHVLIGPVTEEGFADLGDQYRTWSLPVQIWTPQGNQSTLFGYQYAVEEALNPLGYVTRQVTVLSGTPIHWWGLELTVEKIMRRE